MNVQMAPSLQSEHRLILQRIPEPAANGQSQRKPEEIYVVPTELERKEKILQRIPIAFHAVQAFLRETSRGRRLSLLHSSAFRCRNQGAEEVQEHALPSACRRTTVSLRPRTKIRRRKR